MNPEDYPLGTLVRTPDDALYVRGSSVDKKPSWRRMVAVPNASYLDVRGEVVYTPKGAA